MTSFYFLHSFQRGWWAVKKGQNNVYVIFECPLSLPISSSSSICVGGGGGGGLDILTELFDDTVLVTSTFAGEGRLFCTTLAGDLSGLLVLTDGGGVPGTVFGRVLLMTECTDTVDGDLVVYL